MLRADKISFGLKDKTILQEVSLTLESGKILSILGPNGAGKSTLLKCLAGFLKATRGSVYLEERSLCDIPLHTLASRRAVLTQQTVLDFPFTVREVAAMGRQVRSVSRRAGSEDAIIRGALVLTSTDHLENRLFSTLSGGEQQRVHLARVMAQLWEQEKALLLLDEPTSALDLKHQFMLFDICNKLCAEKGFAVVTVLHDLRLAKTVSNKALFLQDGHVFASGDSETVINTEVICALYDLNPSQVPL